MRNFFIADSHLGHANIIKYCKRPFLNAEEIAKLEAGESFTPCNETVRVHNRTIIDNINACVREDDRLWVIGDFCWGPYTRAERYISNIRCNDIRLVWGNHDQLSVGSLFKATYDIVSYEIEGQPVVMCHYPMRSWNKSHHGSWHLFGHVHGNLEDIPHSLSLDVGVDTHNFRPWSWEEIKAYMEPKLPIWRKHRESWRDKELGGMAPRINAV